jgi:hypothetical protein
MAPVGGDLDPVRGKILGRSSWISPKSIVQRTAPAIPHVGEFQGGYPTDFALQARMVARGGVRYAPALVAKIARTPVISDFSF